MTGDERAPALPDFLANGGAMGALISGRNWNDTRLGALEGWPDSRKSMFATILGSPRPMYVLLGPELLFFCNDAYAPMLGARLGAAPGRPFAQVWPELWADFEPILGKALSGQGSSYENMPLTLARNGYPELTWWTFSYLPLRDAKGAVVGVHCICMETTAQVQAQESLAQKQKLQAFWVELTDALREACDKNDLMAIAAQKLGLYLNTSCVGYANIDESGQWGRMEQGWVAGEGLPLTGAQRLDNFGPLVIAQLRAGRSVAVNDTANDPLLVGAAHQSMGSQAFIDAPLVKNGRFAALLFVLNAAPRVWSDSEQALVEEVAERTWAALQRLQAELELRQSILVLDQRTTELLQSEHALRHSQKLEALGQLTGGIAHDVNNLLAVISSSAELLRNRSLPEVQRDHYLERIFDTVGRAAKLTGQLLAFARQQPLKPEVFDVGRRLLGVVDLVRPLLGKGVQIDLVGCEEQCCLAKADINQFETALVNLAVNARDAMDAQGQITVQVRQVDRIPAGPGRDRQVGDRPGDFVAISIRDTGCGMAADQLDAIFEPFYTTKEVGKGTGLGLSQVFGFARQSGGDIAVTSQPGSGSVFTLYLPRADGALAPSTVAVLPEASTQEQGVRVLVVEDNDILGEMTCEILNARGYRAVWAASAGDALELLAQRKDEFDLVFSDVVMPGMNGIELGKQVRLRYPGLPVVLTSGYNAVMAHDGHHGFELIVKPYTADTLARVFRKATTEQA
jgi:signal transduction histidine kinase